MALKLNYSAKSLLDVKFTKNVKGYDPYQVDKALDKAIEDYENYEKYHKESAEYIRKLETDVQKLKDTVRNQEVEIARLNNRSKDLNADGNANVNSNNIDLLRRISQLEKALYQKGVDPTKIK